MSGTLPTPVCCLASTTCNVRLLPYQIRPLGQDSLLCLISTNWSLSPADGPLWTKSKPGHPLKSFAVPCRSGLVTLSPAPVLTHPAEELPVRLAHRVKELDELPHNLSEMPSIKKVKNWYAQSFEVRIFSIPGLRSLTTLSGAYQLPPGRPA